MVNDIITVFTDALTGLLTAVGQAMLDAFDLLIYVPAVTTPTAIPGHLTGLATWSLVFGAIALVLGIVNRFTRA